MILARLCRSVCVCVGVTCAAAVCAQPYPERPIQVVVPMQAGSAGDTIVRIVAQKLSVQLGQALVVENVPGAAGLIGAERIARAAPDGYTIGAMGDSVLTFVPHLHPKVGFDPLTGFEPVSLIATIPFLLAVNPALPAATVSELVALAKARPGALEFASGGNGSPQHVVMALFQGATGISMTHVPYRGAAQAVTDVVSGHVPVVFTALSALLPYVREGKLRGLAVVSGERSGLLPSVPTLAEAGVPGFGFSTWVAVYAPKGTPRPVITRLNAATAAAVGDPSVRERLVALGLEPAASSPDELAVRTREGYVRMGRAIKEAGIRPQ